jgi:hypothetical protein
VLAAVREWFEASARPSGRRIAVLAVLVAGLGVAGWIGVRSTDGGTGGTAEPQAPVVAASSPLPETTALDPAATGERPVADSGEAPATPEEWRAVVAALYERRAEAFAAADGAVLDEVYTPDSPLHAADEQHVRDLAAAGEALRGFAPTVVTVTAVSRSAERVELDLVDHWPAYEVVAAADPAGAAVRPAAGRSGTGVRMVLAHTPGGWRIDSAQRRP